MQTQIDEQGKRSHNKVLFEDLHSQMPTMRIYAKIAAEIRHFRRPSAENHTLTVILPGVRRRCPGTQASPPAKCPCLLKIHLPVIIGRT